MAFADLLSRCPGDRFDCTVERAACGLDRGPYRVMTPAKLRIARHMLDTGNTVTEVAATIGVGRGTVYRHVGR